MAGTVGVMVEGMAVDTEGDMDSLLLNSKERAAVGWVWELLLLLVPRVLSAVR